MQLRHLGTLPGGYTTELSFAPDGQTWACARMGLIQLWRSTRQLYEIELPGHPMGPVRFTEHGELLLAGPFLVNVQDGRLESLPQILDRLGSGLEDFALGPAQMAPQQAMFTPDTSALLVYARYQPDQGFGTAQYRGPEERLVLLDGRTREPRAVLWEGNGLINCRVLDATNTHLAAGGMGTRLWNLNPLHLLGEYPPAQVQVNALRFSSDGLRLAYADAAGLMTVREVSNGNGRDWLADSAGVFSLCFSPDGKRIFSGGMDGALTVWTIQPEPQSLFVHHFPASVDAVALSPAGDQLLVALGGRLQNIELYEISDHGGT